MRNNLSSKWPYFFDAVPLSIIVALTLFSTSVMVLLLLNYLTSIAVVFISIPLATAGFITSCRLFVRTRRSSKSLTRSENTANVLIFVGVFVWGMFNMFYVSQHTYVNRDPGIYTVTARWIVDNEDLNIPSLSSDNQNITGTSAGFEMNPTNTDIFNAQGQHLLPVLAGLAARLLGVSMIFYANVLFGMTALLALFAFSKNFLRPYWALVPPAAVALSMPFLHFSRDNYTELLALTFIFGGLAFMHHAQNNDSGLTIWFLTGLTIGASTLSRIDSYLVWIAIIVFAGINIHNGLKRTSIDKELIIKNTLFLLGALLVTLIGWLDLTQLSASYYQDIRTLFMQIVFGLVLVFILTVILIAVMQLAWLRKFSNNLNLVWVKNTIFVVVIIFFGIMLLRPWLIDSNLPEIIKNLVSRLGVASTEAGRKAAYYSALWPIWYFGHLILLGFIGFALSIRTLVEKKVTRNSALAASLTLMMTVMIIYFIRPSIAPDHVWATRRQLPIIMPTLVIFTVVMVSKLFSKFPKKAWKPQRVVVGLLVTVLLVVLPILTSKPMLFVRQNARLSEINDICNITGKDGSVLWFGRAGPELTMSTRSFCDNQAFSTTGARLSSKNYISLDREILDDFVSESSRNNSKPYIGVYASQIDLVALLENEMNNSTRYYVSTNYYRLERVIIAPAYPPKNVISAFSGLILIDVSDVAGEQITFKQPDIVK